MRTVVGPNDELTTHDRLWPKEHGAWWRRQLGTDGQIAERLREHPSDTLEGLLDHVTAIAQTATDRAAAAERRAGTIAGAVAIAASFTLTGSGLVIDPTKITDATVRGICAAILALTTIMFVLSAVYALRALVKARVWVWENPQDLPTDASESADERLVQRATHLLGDFTRTWEISDWKNRNVDNALWCLLGALIGVSLLAVVIAGAVLFDPASAPTGGAGT